MNKKYRIFSIINKVQQILCIVLFIMLFQSTTLAQLTPADSSNANLIALNISYGTLSPVFDSNSVSYTATVRYEMNPLRVTPTAKISDAKVELRLNNGSYATIISGSSSNFLPLKLGSNVVEVKVTSVKGTTTKLYTLNITRKAEDAISILSGNANYSKEASPQGALRYQRGFYLIKPGELKKSGLLTGSGINGIGFTLSTAQNISTKGAFKLYLQNTDDKASRVDSVWQIESSSVDSLVIDGLYPGDYEWKVRTINGSSSSIFSDTLTFNNDDLKSCQSPTNLTSTEIDSTTIKLSWDAPAGSISKYFLEYKYQDTAAVAWKRVNVTGTTYTATGLKSKKQYLWRIKTSCSASDSSEFNESQFATTNVISCTGSFYTISSFNAVPKDTGVLFKWSKLDSAKSYDVRFRRFGTDKWIEIYTVNDSLKIDSGLVPGTKYEWQVRANCRSGYGKYFPTVTNKFSTTGTTKIYSPINLSVNKLTNSSAILKWNGDGISGNSYEVSYRLKKTISWQHAITGMSDYYNDSITIPNTAGPYNIPFTLPPFTYNGGGIYVAWEYSQSDAALSTPNFSLCTNDSTLFKNSKGIDSGATILGFTGKNNFNNGGTKLQDTLISNDFRPETRFSTTNLKDSVEVLEVYTLGNAIPKFQSPIPISALVTNKSSRNKQYSVTLKVKQKTSGITKYTETNNLTVEAGDTAVVSFNGWNPKSFETDSIIVTIPQDGGENILNNNTKVFVQNLNATTISYADDNLSAFAVGFKTNSGGLLLNRHHLNDSAKVIAAQIYLTDSALNHSFYAVVCDSNKNIVAQSSHITIQEKDINQYLSFYFPNPVSFKNEDFYIGLAQSASSTKYLPLGSQWEGTKPRENAYYMANLNGSGFVDSPQLGRLMIKAQVITSNQDCFIDGKTKLCASGVLTLTAGKAEKRYANRVINYSSQFDIDNNNYNANQILGTPDVYPLSGFAPGAWTSQTPDNRNEFIELGFPDADSINFVDIYEIQNAGAVDSIFTMNPVTSSYELKWHWNGDTSVAEVARKNHIKLDSMISYPVSQIKITLRSDTSKGGVAGFNTIDAVAIGKEEIPGNFDTYSWTPGGETSQSINVSSPGTYVLTTKDTSGHESVDSIEILVSTPVTPKIFILDTFRYPRPNGTFCFGDSINLASDQARGNLWSTNETSNYVTVKNSSSITVRYTDENGCNATSTPFVVTANALPVPVIDATNNGKLCPGKSVTLTTTQPFNNYKWSTGSSQSSITMSRSGNYNVQVTDNNGCKGTSSSSSIIAVSNPQPVISGALRFCPDDSTTLTVDNYSSYLWSNGSTTNTSVVKNIGGINVTVTNGDGCEGSASVSVSLFAKPTPSIIGKEKICPGETITITEGAGNYINYLWTPGNYSTSSIQINQTGTYNVKVTDQNGCKADINRTFSQAPVPTPVVTSNVASTPSTGVNRVFAFCPKTSLTLFAGAGYNSYTWSSYSNNNSVRLGSGSSILTDSSSTYIVAVTNDLGCKGTDTVKTVASGFAPPSPITISGTSLVTCNAVQYTYSIPSISNAEYYIWKVPNGVTILSGQGTTSINVTYGSSFKLGAIQVEAGNRCGISPGRTATSFAVTALSDKPGAISGKSTGVCTAITETYSVPVSSRATSYAWTVPTGATIASGQGTRTITLTFNTRFITGTLSVISVNSCGSSEATSLLISGYPQKPGMVSGPSIVCSYQTNLIYSIDPVPGATSYQWFVPSTAGIVSGQGTRTIAMRMGTKEGRVKVITVSSCGKSSDTSNIGVILNTTCIVGAMPPPTNTTSFNGKTIKPIPEVIANTGGSVKTNKLDLEWTLGETIVQTEVSPVMMYTQGFHEPLSYIKIPSREGANLMISDLINIKVYPNPISSVLKLEFGTTENMGTQNLQLEVQDVYGRTVKNKVVQTDNKVQEINMTNVMSGNYFLVIRNENGTLLRTIKLVKTN